MGVNSFGMEVNEPAARGVQTMVGKEKFSAEIGVGVCIEPAKED